MAIGGSDSRGVWLKVVMGVIAVGAVGALVMSLVGGGGDSGRPDLKAEVTLMCTSCNQSTGVTMGELRKMKMTRPQSDYEPPAVECPKCGQMAAYRAETCPQCKQSFLASKARRLPSGGWECPHCKADTRAARSQ